MIKKHNYNINRMKIKVKININYIKTYKYMKKLYKVADNNFKCNCVYNFKLSKLFFKVNINFMGYTIVYYA